MAKGTYQEKKTSGKKNGLIVVLIVILAVIAAVAVTLAMTGNNDGPGSANQGTSQTSLADTSSGVIETPVGKLTFPEAWAQQVWVKEASSGDQYTVDFYGSAGGEDVLLFSLSVGPTGVGYQIGSVPDAAGVAQSVWLEVSEIQAQDGWTEEEASDINMMQSCVNDLIEQIRALEGFRENG